MLKQYNISSVEILLRQTI